MSRAWIVDLWVKNAQVAMPDGSTRKIAPSAAELKAITTLPQEFRSAKYGRGKRWKTTWHVEDGGEKNQRSRAFDTKKEAEAFAAELEDDIRRGRYIDPALRSKTFAEAAEVWFASKHSLAESSQRKYARELENYVLPRWATVPLEAITREAIDAWIVDLRKGEAPFSFSDSSHTTPSKRKPGKMAPSYVRSVVGKVFGAVLRHVVDQGWIGRNPMSGVKLPRIIERDRENLPSLTYQEVEALATEAERLTGKLDDRVLVHLLAYGGTRIGEATALQTSDLDIENRRVRVSRTWTEDLEGKRVLGEPKGRERRWVHLPEFLADEMAELVSHRTDDEFIFQSKRGEAINAGNWRQRVWEDAKQAVPKAATYTVHDLRHVASTLAIGAGADVKLVQQMLGHKDATVTLNTYASLWADNVDEVARKIEERRSRALNSPKESE